MKAIPFDGVEIGEVFTTMQGAVFIKQAEKGHYAGLCNAKSLDGSFAYFSPAMMVLVYEEDLNIDGETI
jgi:hypothetical protein